MYEFSDEHGQHKHPTKEYGQAYDHNAPLTCTACLSMLDKAADVWETKYAVRDGHDPDTFWTGYKRLWRQ